MQNILVNAFLRGHHAVWLVHWATGQFQRCEGGFFWLVNLLAWDHFYLFCRHHRAVTVVCIGGPISCVDGGKPWRHACEILFAQSGPCLAFSESSDRAWLSDAVDSTHFAGAIATLSNRTYFRPPEDLLRQILDGRPRRVKQVRTQLVVKVAAVRLNILNIAAT